MDRTATDGPPLIETIWLLKWYVKISWTKTSLTAHVYLKAFSINRSIYYNKQTKKCKFYELCGSKNIILKVYLTVDIWSIDPSMIFDSIFSGLAPVIYKSKTPLRAMEGPLIFTSALYLLFWSPFVSINIYFLWFWKHITQ